MFKKVIINIRNIEEIEFYKNNDINNFLIPIKDFCVGYNEIDINDIKKINDNIYLLINRVLDKKGIDNLREVLPLLNNIKGIFFDDLGVLSIINELKLDVEKIYFPNHFATNYASINSFLKRGIDSVVVSNEITKDEVNTILNNVNKPIVLQVLGYNQIMYSRRKLISNFAHEYHDNLSLDSKIKEQTTEKILKIKENEFGTVIFDEKIYNNLELMQNNNNVKFFYVNATDLEPKLIVKTLNKIIVLPNSKNGFLNQKTVFKVGDLK